MYVIIIELLFLIDIFLFNVCCKLVVAASKMEFRYSKLFQPVIESEIGLIPSSVLQYPFVSYSKHKILIIYKFTILSSLSINSVFKILKS